MIEEAIFKWVEGVTGLPCWESPVSNAGEKPAGDYATYKMVSMVMSDFNQGDAVVKDADFITKTTYNNAKMLLSLNVFSDRGYNHIIELNHSAEFWDSRNTLKDGGLSINRFGNPQNLTGLGDTGFVNRWQSDIEFMVTVETQKDWDRLKQIELNGSFTNDDATLIIDSVARWP